MKSIIDTFGGSDDISNVQELIDAANDTSKVVDPEELTARAASVKSIFDTFGGDLSNVQNLVDVANDLDYNFDSTDINNRANAVKSIVGTFNASDVPNVQALIDAANDTSKSVDTGELLKRSTAYYVLQEEGYQGVDINNIYESLLDIDNTNADDLVSQIEYKIIQSYLYDTNDFDELENNADYKADNIAIAAGINPYEGLTIDIEDIDLGKLAYIADLASKLSGSEDAISTAIDAYNVKDNLTDNSNILANVLLGFTFDELYELSDSAYEFYSAARSKADANLRLSKSQAELAYNTGYQLSELSSLSLLINHDENDGSYTIESIHGKDLDLMVDALELEDSDFSQSEALTLGGQDKFDSSDLQAIQK